MRETAPAIIDDWRAQADAAEAEIAGCDLAAQYRRDDRAAAARAETLRECADRLETWWTAI